MATITRVPGLPNILVVDGIDPHSDYRSALRSALYAAGDSSPVHRGTHDFWLCFPYPAQDEFNPNSANFGFADESARDAGRMLRGIGDMRRLPPTPSVNEVQSRLFTTLHEAAHAWLVPSDLSVRSNGSVLSPLSAEEVTALLNQERPFVRPALLARQNAHWSCYVNFASCMDSVLWNRTPDIAGMTRWTYGEPALLPVRPAGLPPVQTSAATYSDLDLLIMGLKSPAECFPETGGQFYWLEPKLSLGPPMQYLAGLFIAFSPTDYLYFGFYNDHGKLRVERSANSQRSDIINIGSAYQPLRDEYEAMMLRVVKRGNRYFFQACHGNSASAVLSGQGPFMFDHTNNVATAPTTGAFNQWQTVAVFEVNNATPQAIGVITKTWNPILVEAQFFTFEIQEGTVNSAMNLPNAVPAATGLQPFSALPSDRLIPETPQVGSLFRRRNFSAIVGVPYTDTYDHWNAVNNAPKIMRRAPAGDFSFGVTAKVHRSLVSPWTGGAAYGMTMWGIERSANTSDVMVPERIRRNWAHARGWLPVEYKKAFIVVTNRHSDVRTTDLNTLDVFRRYYDAAFGAVTHGLASSNSNL